MTPGDYWVPPLDFNQPVKDVSKDQVGGDHYKKLPIQPWEYIWMNNLDYWQGEIISYITRHKDKGGVEDLKKAKHTLDKYISLLEGEKS